MLLLFSVFSVASMFKDDMDLSQETIEKLLEAVGSASKAKGNRRLPSTQQRDKVPAFNDSIGSPYEEQGIRYATIQTKYILYRF